MVMNVLESAGARMILALAFGLITVAPAQDDSAIHYVKWDATGSNNGTSWTNAYTDLQSALMAASSPAETKHCSLKETLKQTSPF